ncbi:transporter [Clostridia bacterium]|nr:transporter [Clostridia bacterium]
MNLKKLKFLSAIRIWIIDFFTDQKIINKRMKYMAKGKKLLFSLFRLAVILGIGYAILGPIIGIISSSFFSDTDRYDPMVFLIPKIPTLMRYDLAIARLEYFKTLGKTTLYVLGLTGIQVWVCALVGYGFARFEFPLKKILFGCVIIMIVFPAHSIMLPIYMLFREFDVFGIINLIAKKPLNLLGTPVPMYIMTMFATGLRSGLYIFIFNQFFRGIPKELEESAQVDGANAFFTYLRVMLPCAVPAIVTVSIFSLVWQYNDTFYAKLFLIDPSIVLSKRITTLEDTILNNDQVRDPAIMTLYVNAGVVLAMIPIVLFYIILQKQFIEGVEQSGIVG